MADEPFAHSGTPGNHADWQTLADHLQGVADLAEARGGPIGLAAPARLAGALHDFGKHDPAFQRRLAGDARSVDHSTAGAKLLLDRAKGDERVAAEVLAYAILGHHAGLPDARGADGSMERRIDQFRDPIPPGITAAVKTDFAPLLPELVKRMRQGQQAGFDLSVAGRMIFSCLVDADFRDTELFYNRLEGLLVTMDDHQQERDRVLRQQACGKVFDAVQVRILVGGGDLGAQRGGQQRQHAAPHAFIGGQAGEEQQLGGLGHG